MSGRLLLIDGHALAYRAYFALAKTQMRTIHGEPTWAIYGFLNMLLDAVGRFHPSHLAVCLDAPRSSLRRRELFPAYKGQRKAAPDDLRTQLVHIHTTIGAFGFPSYRVPGYEADDIIGTIAHRAVREGLVVKILTGDKDLLQLVAPSVQVALPTVGAPGLTEYDEATTEIKMGVSPGQIPDFKGLAGDQADNIPGVPNIGETRARKLLAEHGTLDGIYAHLDQVSSPKIRGALRDFRAQAELSRELATIVRDVPVELDWCHCEIRYPDRDALTEVLGRFELFGLLAELSRHLGHLVPAAMVIEFEEDGLPI